MHGFSLCRRKAWSCGDCTDHNQGGGGKNDASHVSSVSQTAPAHSPCHYTECGRRSCVSKHLRMIGFRLEGCRVFFVERKDLYEFALLFSQIHLVQGEGLIVMAAPGSAAGAVPSSSSTPDSARFVSTGLRLPPRNSMKRCRTGMARCGGRIARGRIPPAENPRTDQWIEYAMPERMRTTGEPGLTIPQTRFPSGTRITKVTSCAYSPWIKAWRTTGARLPSATARFASYWSSTSM